MTLIMGLTVGNVPVLMGDLLVTSCGESDKKFSTPAFDNVNEFLNEKVYAHVVQLRQKVNVLSDSVILAWAGSFIQANSLFREVAQELKSGSNRHVADIIRDTPPEDKNELAVIGLVRGASKTRLVWHNAYQYQSKMLSNVVVAGSGAGDMAALIEDWESDWDDSKIEQGVEDYGRVILTAIGLGNQVAGIERATGENLLNLWGGGIEIALYDKDRARKVDNVLYAFWDYEKQGDGSYELKPIIRFVKLEYQKGLLLIRTISATGPDNTVVWNKITAVPPLLSPYTRHDVVEIDEPRLTYDWLCSSIVIRDGSLIIDVVPNVKTRGFGQLIRFHEHGQNLHIEASNGYREELIALAESELAKRGWSKGFVNRP